MRQWILQNNIEPYALIIYDDCIIGDVWEVKRYLIETIKEELLNGNYEYIKDMEMLDILVDIEEKELEDDELIKVDYHLMGSYDIVVYEEKESKE